MEDGLVPVTVGLMLAGGYLITLSADHSWPAFAITAVTAAVVLATRIHPLWLLGVAGLIGLAGWGLPLAADQVRFGLGPTAQSLATIMGFAHQSAIPLALTVIVGLLLGLSGAWLGSAARSLVASNAPVDAERTE